jgi:hypothetical protein
VLLPSLGSRDAPAGKESAQLPSFFEDEGGIMKYYRWMVLVALCAVGLSGCGLAARNNYAASTSVYRECVNANSTNPQVCEGKRRAMEADERFFNNTVAPFSRGVGTENINTEPLKSVARASYEGPHRKAKLER